MTTVHVTPQSSNKKTGPIPVTTTEASTCPPSCSWNGSGCYADYGPLGFHWRLVSEGKRGMEWEDFLQWVRSLPSGTLWRHNQAGDLPGWGEELDKEACLELASAARVTRGFTYTHKDFRKHHKTLKRMRELNFVVNTSCDNEKDMLDSVKLGIPTTTMIPREHRDKRKYTVKGVTVARCPAEYLDKDCLSCMLCAEPYRQVVVGFTPHGSGKNRVEENLE